MAALLKRSSFYGLVGFFVLAGLYHFINPEFYYPLIPDYFPYKVVINYVSGVAEIGLGLLLLWPAWRTQAAYLLIVLLLAFIPAHVYFIQLGSCIPNDGLCVPEWVGWVRLVVIHPLLLYWILIHRKA